MSRHPIETNRLKCVLGPTFYSPFGSGPTRGNTVDGGLGRLSLPLKILTYY